MDGAWRRSRNILQRLPDILGVVGPPVVENPKHIVALVDPRLVPQGFWVFAGAITAHIPHLDAALVIVLLVEDFFELVNLGL